MKILNQLAYVRSTYTMGVVLILLTTSCGGNSPTTSMLEPEDHTVSLISEGQNVSPLSAAELNFSRWTWIPVEESTCRDGSTTGYGVRLQPGATELAIFLEEGYSCLNEVTCKINPESFDEDDFRRWRRRWGSENFFSTQDPQNPVRDWNMVYVPYCTGDVHGGTKRDVEILPGVLPPQQFVGYENIQLYLEEIAPYFDNVDRVLLTGTSAGGFGAAINYVQVAEAFDPTPITLVSDSGPLLPNDEALAPCLQKKVIEEFGLDQSLPPDFVANFIDDDGDGLSNIYTYLTQQYPEANFGLLSTDSDLVIRYFYGVDFEDVECSSKRVLAPARAYREGLLTLRDEELIPTGQWATFYQDSPRHKYLRYDRYTEQQVDGVTPQLWLSEFLDGTLLQVGP